MSIIGGILAIHQDPSYGFGDPHFWPVTQGRQTTAGEWVSGDTALALPVYWACLQAISMDIAKLAVHMYRRDGANKSPADDHPVAMIFRDEPNPEMTAFTMLETVTQWGLGWGNGYGEIVRNGRGNAVEVWPIHPSRVEVKRDAADLGGRVWYSVKPGDNSTGTAKRLESDDMFHLRGMGTGIEGFSVFRAASESIGYAMAARRHGSAFFGNGLNVNFALRHPNEMSEEAIKHLRASLKQTHSGGGNAFNPFILEEGMEITKLTVDPKEAQVLEVLEFQIEEIARWFRMPPHKLGQSRRAQGWSTVEMANIDYVIDTMMPWVRRWETEISRKLLSPEERRTYFIEFSMESLLRGDSKARSEFYQTMQMNGNYTINDVLRKENMNGIGPLGDKRFVPVNLQTLERASAAVEPDEPEPEEPGDDGPDAEAVSIAITAMAQPELSRAVKRQAAQVKAAAKKHAGDAAAFGAWADKFYAGLGAELAETLGQIGDGVGRITGIAGAGATARAFAADHCSRMSATITQAFVEGAEALVVEGWERDGLATAEAGRLAAAIVGGAV